MDYRPLGRSGIEVSAICLGTMTWGTQNSEEEGFAQMDLAVDRGVNFFDAAEMYPVPPTAETQGRTEEIVGNWLQSRKCRDKIVLATKVTGPGPRFSYIRDGDCRLDRKNITAAIETSLQRLRTDYIDLYQLHWPDRATNIFGRLGFDDEADETAVPLEETLEVLDELVRSGKVRSVGLSNETPWGTMTFLKLAEAGKGPRMVSVQNPYSLLNRSFEVGLAEVAIREDCGLLAYAPIAAGVLSGKYLGGARPPAPASRSIRKTTATRNRPPNRPCKSTWTWHGNTACGRKSWRTPLWFRGPSRPLPSSAPPPWSNSRFSSRP